MVSAKDVVLQQLESGQMLLGLFTADLSDAEYFKPAAPGTNHAGWILGHLATSEDSLVSKITGKPRRIDEAKHSLFGGSSKCVADALKYPARGKLDELFRDSRANTIEQLGMFDMSQWESPSPEGLPTELFSTVGSVWALQATHQFWHIGQLTTCRKALNKKSVLF